MTVRATDILKAIQNLNPAEKHRLREYLIVALTASFSTVAFLSGSFDIVIGIYVYGRNTIVDKLVEEALKRSFLFVFIIKVNTKQ